MLLKRYWFLSLLFIAHLTYAGEFGNYCLLSLSEGRFLKTDCSVNASYQGKVYCFGSEISKDIFLKTPDEFIKKAADRKSTRLNSSHIPLSRMPSSA